VVIWQFDLLPLAGCPSLAPILDNTDPLLALVIILGFYLHHVEVADQDPAIGNL